MGLNTLPPIICLTGPTATGKSDLAIDLVHTFNCEIISVDSAMVYRGLNIGTAKPDVTILQQIPHHLIDIQDPNHPYSAGDFFRDVQVKIKEIMQRQRTPLLVGGTMLYFHILQKGLANLPHYTQYDHYAAVKKEIEAIELPALYAQLKQCDPEATQRIHAHDTQRIQRAMMVYRLTGRPLSELQKKTPPSLPYSMHWVTLYPHNRTQLKEKITTRFNHMLNEGLIEEVKQLYDRPDLHADLPACRSVGYRQIWQYLEGKIDYTTMKERSIIATCQLAKRQMTWLRQWPQLKYFYTDEPHLLEKIKIYLQIQLG